MTEINFKNILMYGGVSMIILGISLLEGLNMGAKIFINGVLIFIFGWGIDDK